MVKTGAHRRVMLNAAGPFNQHFRFADLHGLVSAAHALEKGHRAAKTQARRETRWEIEQGLADLAEERRLVAAHAHLDQVLAKWRDIRQAMRDAGLDKPARDEVKAEVIGEKCPVCASRICQRTVADCERTMWE